MSRRIGLTGQDAALDEYLTGRANLIMIGRLARLGRSQAHQRADELLERFDLIAAGRAGRSRPTPAGCAAAWTWLPASSAGGKACTHLSRTVGGPGLGLPG